MVFLGGINQIKAMEATSSKEKEVLSGEIFYPDSDGQPMSDNTLQFEWISSIKWGFEGFFKNRTDVFVAGDLLWYPVEGSNKIRVAPDVMVAFGRPKGYRGSYMQWKEDNIPPQVVFEILSPGNTVPEMLKKQDFYTKHGVKEYYIYDPDNNEFWTYVRNQGFLQSQVVDPSWHSPLLDVTFELTGDSLKIYDSNGKPFLTYLEILEENERLDFEAEKQKAEAEKQKAEAIRQKAEVEKQKAEVVKQKAEKEQALEEENKAISEKEAEIAHLKALLEQAGLKNI